MKDVILSLLITFGLVGLAFLLTELIGNNER